MGFIHSGALASDEEAFKATLTGIEGLGSPIGSPALEFRPSDVPFIEPLAFGLEAPRRPARELPSGIWGSRLEVPISSAQFPML